MKMMLIRRRMVMVSQAKEMILVMSRSTMKRFMELKG